MKKVFFLIIYIFLSIFVIVGQSFAGTLSFNTIDGRNFCETDRFDGSFVLCNREQLAGTGLSMAAAYGPQLLETTTQRICVEKGKEVNVDLCSEQAAALEQLKIPPVVKIEDTGSVTSIASTGTIQSGSIIESIRVVQATPEIVSTGTTASGSVDSTGEVVPPISVISEIEQGVSVFISKTIIQIRGMSTDQIFLAGMAFVLATILMGIYYVIRRGHRKHVETMSTASTHASQRHRPPLANGEVAPHRVVNRWVPAPPPPSRNIVPPVSSLFVAPPANTSVPPSANHATSPANSLPATPANTASTPAQSSFLANHLGEL